MGEFNKLNTALSNPNLSKTMRNYLMSVRNKAVKNSAAKKIANEEKERQRIANNEARFKRIQDYVDREKMLYSLQAGNLITYNNEGTKKNGVILKSYANTYKNYGIRGAVAQVYPNTWRKSTFVIREKNVKNVTRRNKGGSRRKQTRRRKY